MRGVADCVIAHLSPKRAVPLRFRAKAPLTCKCFENCKSENILPLMILKLGAKLGLFEASFKLLPTMCRSLSS